MNLADKITVSSVGGDEAGQTDYPSVSKQLGNLSDAADVLSAVCSRNMALSVREKQTHTNH